MSQSSSPMLTARDAERFWRHVDVRGHIECWPWRSATNNRGYGVFSVGGRHGGMHLAHRIAYQLGNGSLLAERHGRHVCDNPLCCNPRHIVPGSHADNMRDMAERERARNTRLSADAVIAIRQAVGRGERHRTIASRFGIATSNVSMIARHATWKHLPTVETLARLLEGGPDEVTF